MIITNKMLESIVAAIRVLLEDNTEKINKIYNDIGEGKISLNLKVKIQEERDNINLKTSIKFKNEDVYDETVETIPLYPDGDEA